MKSRSLQNWPWILGNKKIYQKHKVEPKITKWKILSLTIKKLAERDAQSTFLHFFFLHFLVRFRILSKRNPSCDRKMLSRASKTAFRVSRGTFYDRRLGKKFPDFQQTIIRFRVENSRLGCQNCILCVQRIFGRKKTENKLWIFSFRGFERNKWGRIVKTASYVCK